MDGGPIFGGLTGARYCISYPSMPVMEMEPDVRLRGRAVAPLEVRVVGEISESDLALLASERGIKPSKIKRLHDRHHALAKCLADGMSGAEASAVTGYDPSRISILKGDPSFQELIKHYRDVKDACFADFQERASVVANQALEVVRDHVERALDGDAPMSAQEALGIVESLADRTGNAPVAKSIAVGVNVELGQRLSNARLRLSQGSPNKRTDQEEAA